MVNIFAPSPNISPSIRYSIAEDATPLANPVIGTKVPAPPNFANFAYHPVPVSNVLIKINVIVVQYAAFS